MPTNNDPWYARTEFWLTLAHCVASVVAVAGGVIAPPIGMGIAALSSMVYTFGRSNVKAQQAAAVLSAVGQGLSAPAAPGK